jgi:hypothetical protein
MYFIHVSSIIISDISIGHTVPGPLFSSSQEHQLSNRDSVNFSMLFCSGAPIETDDSDSACSTPRRMPILHSSVHLKEEHTLFSTLRTAIASASPALFPNSKPAAASTRQAPMSAPIFLHCIYLWKTVGVRTVRIMQHTKHKLHHSVLVTVRQREITRDVGRERKNEDNLCFGIADPDSGGSKV